MVATIVEGEGRVCARRETNMSSCEGDGWGGREGGEMKAKIEKE